ETDEKYGEVQNPCTIRSHGGAAAFTLISRMRGNTVVWKSNYIRRPTPRAFLRFPMPALRMAEQGSIETLRIVIIAIPRSKQFQFEFV
ncbi:MAG TPA: hypothetical protein VGL71_12870, partial [Urbifossiella sp.]